MSPYAGLEWTIIILLIIIGIIIVCSYSFPTSEKSMIKPNNQTVATGIHMYCDAQNLCDTPFDCVNNRCLAPFGSVCTQITDCVQGTVSCNGRCMKGLGDLGSKCTTNSDCSAGFLECNNGYCLNPISQTCSNSYQCVEGAVCIDQTCTTALGPLGNCTNSAECMIGDRCLNGKCQPFDAISNGGLESYCLDQSCLGSLTCSFLNTEIGNCKRAVLEMGSFCTQVLGCVDGLTCLGGSCVLPTPINSCAYNTCVEGMSCVSNGCLSTTTCNVDANCKEGTCSRIALFEYDGLGYKIIETTDSIDQTVSISEQPMGNPVPLYYADQKFKFGGQEYSISNSSVELKMAQITQSYDVVMHVRVNNTFDKIIKRGLTGLSTSITLTSPELTQWGSITNIQFFNYDNQSNIVYFGAGTTVYSYNFIINPAQVATNIPSGTINVWHYNVSFTEYSPNTLLYQTPSGLTNQDNYNKNIGFGTLGLTFSQGQTLENFSFIFFNTVLNGWNGTSLYPTPGYVKNISPIFKTYISEKYYFISNACSV